MTWKDRKDIVLFLAVEYDYEVEEIQPWHLRLSIPGEKLDYFPKSGRATWVSSGKWFEIEDIEQFILKQYQNA